LIHKSYFGGDVLKLPRSNPPIEDPKPRRGQK